MIEIKNLNKRFTDDLILGLQNSIDENLNNYDRSERCNHCETGLVVPLSVIETLLDNIEARDNLIEKLKDKIRDMSWRQPAGNRIVPDEAWPGDGENSVRGDMEE